MGSANGGGACFIFQCGCPDQFKESWCTVQSHRYNDDFCAANQANCETCLGSWCPFDGPGGPVTTSTTTTTPQAPGPCGESSSAVHWTDRKRKWCIAVDDFSVFRG